MDLFRSFSKLFACPQLIEMMLLVLGGLLVLYVLDTLPLFHFLGRIRFIIDYTFLQNMWRRVKSWIYRIKRHFNTWICLSSVALSAYRAEKCFRRKSSIFYNLHSLIFSVSFSKLKRLIVNLLHIRAFDCPSQDVHVFGLHQSILVLNHTWTIAQLFILSLFVIAHFRYL